MNYSNPLKLDLLNKEQADYVRSVTPGIPGEDKLLIAVPKNAKTNSGLFIPEKAEGTPRIGTVIKIGHIEGYESYKWDIHIGDHVYFGQYAGKSIDIPFLVSEDIPLINFDNYTYNVLSLNEVLYVVPFNTINHD